MYKGDPRKIIGTTVFKAVFKASNPTPSTLPVPISRPFLMFNTAPPPVVLSQYIKPPVVLVKLLFQTPAALERIVPVTSSLKAGELVPIPTLIPLEVYSDVPVKFNDSAPAALSRTVEPAERIVKTDEVEVTAGKNEISAEALTASVSFNSALCADTPELKVC
jgi:hypothetical protein